MFKFAKTWKLCVPYCLSSRCTVYATFPLLRGNWFWSRAAHVRVTQAASRSYARRAVRELDVEAEAANICSELCHANPTSMDAQTCTEIVRLLLSLDYNKNYVKRTLSDNSVLLKYPLGRWKETASKFQSHGFSSRQLLPLLVACHAFLDGTYWDSLAETIVFLEGLEIPYRQRIDIIARNPALLRETNPKVLLQKYGNVLRAFTKNEAQKIVVKNPNLLTDECEETNKKLTYIYNDMGIRSREIAKSRVFEHSLVHIVTRHLFALRTGVYKTPDKQEIEAKADNRQMLLACANPTLSDLVDTSDRRFAIDVCYMTVPEYEAFTLMIAEEWDPSDEDSDDSSDSDSE